MWWILLIVLVLYFGFKLHKQVNFWKNKGAICVESWPLLGSFGQNMLGRITTVDQFQQFYYHCPEAKFVGLYQLNKPILMLRDPEIIKQVLVKNFDNFINHTVIFTEDIDSLFGKNLLSLRGQQWKDMRATLSPAFTSSKMRTMFILIRECAEQFSQYFLEVEKQKGTLTLEMKDIFTKYTNDVIATCAFGIKCDSLKDDKNQFYMTGKAITNFGSLIRFKFLAFMLLPKLMQALNFGLFSKKTGDFFRMIIKATIQIREREGTVRPDMIHLLMEAQKGRLKHDTTKEGIDEDAGFAIVQESHIGKEDNINKPQLTEEDITAQAILFFMAGYDTSSTLMCFLAHELAVNVDIQKKLQEEIDDTFNKIKGNIDYQSLLNMKYLDMVVSECLRKWPPAPFTERQCMKSYQLKDNNKSVTLDEKQTVWVPVYCLHHDPKYFPDPEKFDPERFNDDNKNSIIPFTYLPFGGGPRNCIGSRFALLEVKALFVYLLAKFDIIVVEKTQVPLKLSKVQFSMIAEKGFWLGLKPRG